MSVIYSICVNFQHYKIYFFITIWSKDLRLLKSPNQLQVTVSNYSYSLVNYVSLLYGYLIVTTVCDKFYNAHYFSLGHSYLKCTLQGTLSINQPSVLRNTILKYSIRKQIQASPRHCLCLLSREFLSYLAS